MGFFNLDFKKFLVILTIAVIPLLSVSLKQGERAALWMTPVHFFTGLLQRGYSSFSVGVRGTTSLYFDLINIKKLNRELSKENTELRAQLGSLTELKLENERLNKLLGFRQPSNMALLAAKVIGKDLLPEHNTITINRGTDHGIQKNMAALTIAGAVGYVFRTQPLTSQILLLTDRYSAIDTIVQRSRARGIVEGYSKDSCKMRYLRRSDDLVAGDLVVTSGLDNIFPKGFPVGVVTEVKKTQYGLSQEVDVSPLVNASILEEVFVVLNANNEDYSQRPIADETKGL